MISYLWNRDIENVYAGDDLLGYVIKGDYVIL